MTHRRDFLKASLAGTGLITWGLSVPRFLARTAWAAPTADKVGAKDTILVVVELNGGNDGLNTVIPFKDPEYAKLRPTLKLPEAQLRKLTDDIGLHPGLEPLMEIHNDGALAVVQGVGYPNPTQSHFDSMDIWQSATRDEARTEGWLGKALKGLPPGTPTFHIKRENEKSPLALEGAPARAPSIASLEEFQLQMAAASGADKRDQREVIDAAVKGAAKKPGLLDFVARTASNTYESSRRLQEIGKNYQPKAIYPPQFQLANNLKLAAQLIDADIGARIFYVSLQGFDTHSGQAPQHALLMVQLSTAISAFYKDMAARGHKDRLLIMTFSEFGRRAKENGSRGTDHGSAAPMFLVGGKVKGGVIGKHPSLTDIPMSNLQHHTDFRQVYAAVLDKWLGVDSKAVLGGKYEPVDVIKA
jgi:uncharacterized protein (DUF1501 family)